MVDIINNTKFDNRTKKIKIYSLHGENKLLIDAVIHDDVLRDAILTAVRDAEKQAFKGNVDYIRKLEEDKKRIDWLSDKEQQIGNVTLPSECVENNISSLRDAIDDAMLL